MMPSPPSAGGCPSSSKKRVISYLEGRSAGVGAFHVIPIPDERNNNDSQVEQSESATVENVFSAQIRQQEQESLQQNVIVELTDDDDGEATEEERVERTGTAYIKHNKGCIGLLTLFLFVSAIGVIAFTLFYNNNSNIADAGGNGEFNRGTAGGPTASPTKMNHYYCDDTRFLPAIDSETIVKRSDRFQALQSVLETGLVDFDPVASDDPCGPHNFALQWLADEDASSDASNADLYQRYAMVLFYVSTNMNSTIVAVHAGKVENPWLTDDPVCLWTGITCSNSPEDNTVTGIELSDLDLYGTIPNEFFILVPYLKTLNVFENRLTGTIPVTLYSSLSIVNLNMGSNRLSGSMDEVEWSTYNLKTLNLADNQLTGSIPGSKGSWTNLVELDLSGNEFTGSIPSEIFNLPDLYMLNLYRNALSGTLPSTLTTSLEYLNLGRNIVGGQLPVALYKLTNLVTFSLESNEISGTLSQMLGNLHNLEELLLKGNQITGMVPNTISKLSNLKILDLSSNIFHGTIPDEIGNMGFIERLFVNMNSFSGTIPSEIGMLTNLLIIEMSNNNLEGSIPSEMGQLARLQKLSLSFNDLTQDIPTEFGMLSDLHILFVEKLSISTQVPAEVCKLREKNLNIFSIDCTPQGTSSNEIILSCDCCTGCF